MEGGRGWLLYLIFFTFHIYFLYVYRYGLHNSTKYIKNPQQINKISENYTTNILVLSKLQC